MRRPSPSETMPSGLPAGMGEASRASIGTTVASSRPSRSARRPLRSRTTTTGSGSLPSRSLLEAEAPELELRGRRHTADARADERVVRAVEQRRNGSLFDEDVVLEPPESVHPRGARLLAGARQPAVVACVLEVRPVAVAARSRRIPRGEKRHEDVGGVSVIGDPEGRGEVERLATPADPLDENRGGEGSYLDAEPDLREVVLDHLRLLEPEGGRPCIEHCVAAPEVAACQAPGDREIGPLQGVEVEVGEARVPWIQQLIGLLPEQRVARLPDDLCA